MRVIAFSRGGVSQDKGTPLRFRHLVKSLGENDEVEIRLVSRDTQSAIARVLPGFDHIPMLPGVETNLLNEQIKIFEPDIIYGETDKSGEIMARLRNRVGMSSKLVVDLHGDLAMERLSDERRSSVNRMISALRTRVNQLRFFPKMDGFTTVGEILAERFVGYGKPIRVLWGGVNIDNFRVIENEPSKFIRVAYAGNYRAYQGVSTLLKAATILVENGEPFHFILVGDIDAFPAMKEMATRALGDRVTLTGKVGYEKIPDILGKADVLVVPRAPIKAAKYNYPSKLSEFLALGRPVVVHGVGEVLRVIKDRYNGLVVPPNRPEALAKALQDLKDVKFRDKLGRNGRIFAEKELTWQLIGRKLYDFLESLL